MRNESENWKIEIYQLCHYNNLENLKFPLTDKIETAGILSRSLNKSFIKYQIIGT